MACPALHNSSRVTQQHLTIHRMHTYPSLPRQWQTPCVMHQTYLQINQRTTHRTPCCNKLQQLLHPTSPPSTPHHHAFSVQPPLYMQTMAGVAGAENASIGGSYSMQAPAELPQEVSSAGSCKRCNDNVTHDLTPKPESRST